jgi:hypothetical protein
MARSLLQSSTMARHRSRIDGLKLPFVVTVAIAAGGCGGTVTGSQGSNDGTGAGAGTGGLGTGAGPSTGGMSTSGGFKGMGGIVNPPPPPQTTCPDATPSPGTYCNYEGPACGYGPLCGSFPTQSASCVDHTWSMSISSCNPPAPMTTTCPVQAPASGSYCNYSGPPCVYPECTGSPCMCIRDATCVGYQWTVQAIDPCVTPPLDAGTPTPPPDAGGTVLPNCDNPVAAGTPCSEPSAHCGGPCSNSWQADNVCTNGIWTFAGVVACGPNASNAPQCRNQFSGGALTPCCSVEKLDCNGKPDGYPGFGCTPGDGSYCSCNCFGGAQACAC